MDGRKLHHFVCFAVTMGLVACASGDTAAGPEPEQEPALAADPDEVSDANSIATVPQSESESATEPQVDSTVNSTTTELDPKPGFTSSRPAPSSASQLPALSRPPPSVRTTSTSESKSCPIAKPDEEVYKKALFLIIGGALLFTCVVLLVTVTALSCKVSHLRGQLSSSRSAQINGAGYWAGGREGGDVAGAGVAETSVMLEEVTSVQNEETATAAAVAAAAVAAEPSGAQAAADEAGRAEEADRGPTAAAAAAGPEPAPAADPDPVESPKTQTAPAPTSEPTADKA